MNHSTIWNSYCACVHMLVRTPGEHIPAILGHPGPRAQGARGPDSIQASPVSGPGKQLNDEILCENIEYPLIIKHGNEKLTIYQS